MAGHGSPNAGKPVLLDGAAAKGESYCLAHHVLVQDAHRSLMVASIRYLDTFVQQDGRWLFSERRLMVDWIETRSLGS